MADKKSNKRAFIEISSTSASSTSTSEESESTQESDGDTVEETSSSTSCNDDDYDESDWDDESDGDDSGTEEEDKSCLNKDDVESMYDRVVQLLRGRSDLQELKLAECKAYLRRHGLRLSGTKEECIERIKEHWRLKNGNAEAFFPRSSFTINCTGDVCKGDVVLFNQKVYETFDKMTRHGSLLGRRTVVGRIVKESYGAARQQHTFTVEVLWCKGTKTLAPLCPLLVKGRNLYTMKTFRQRWKNERERLKVLAEKHKRGAAARNLKAMRNKKSGTKTNKSFTSKGSKSGKSFHHLGPSGTKDANNVKKNCLNENRKAFPGNKRPKQNISPCQALNSKQTRDSKRPKSHWRNQNLMQSNQIREPSLYPNNNPSQISHPFHSGINPRGLHHFVSHRGSASTATLPRNNPLPNSYPIPVSEYQDFSRLAPSTTLIQHFSHASESRKFSPFPGRMNTYPPFYSLPPNPGRMNNYPPFYSLPPNPGRMNTYPPFYSLPPNTNR